MNYFLIAETKHCIDSVNEKRVLLAFGFKDYSPKIVEASGYQRYLVRVLALPQWEFIYILVDQKTEGRLEAGLDSNSQGPHLPSRSYILRIP